MDEINNEFKTLIEEISNVDSDLSIPIKDNYSNIEIIKYLSYLKKSYIEQSQDKSIEKLRISFTTGKRDDLIAKICFINSIVKKKNLKHLKILHSGKKNAYMKEHISLFFNNITEIS